MRLPNFSDEAGSAVLEFVGFGLLLQVPLVSLVVMFSAAQLEQLAAESIARNSLRAYCLAKVSVADSAAQIAQDFALPNTTKASAEISTANGLVSVRVIVGQASAIASGACLD